MIESMPGPIESREGANHLVNDSRAQAPSAPPKRPGPWILRHEAFVRAMCMVGLYIFGAIFLVSVLALGALALVSVVLAALFLALLGIVLFLWARTRLRP